MVQALGACAPDHSRNYQGERKYDFHRWHDRNSELADDTKTPLVAQAITRENFCGDHCGKIASRMNLISFVVDGATLKALRVCASRAELDSRRKLAA
jgi:hypothetical protein